MAFLTNKKMLNLFLTLKSAAMPQSCRFTCLKRKRLNYSVKKGHAAHAAYIPYIHMFFPKLSPNSYRKGLVSSKYAAFAAGH